MDRSIQEAGWGQPVPRFHPTFVIDLLPVPGQLLTLLQTRTLGGTTCFCEVLPSLVLLTRKDWSCRAAVVPCWAFCRALSLVITSSLGVWTETGSKEEVACPKSQRGVWTRLWVWGPLTP